MLRKLLLFAALVCLLAGGAVLAQEDLDLQCADYDATGYLHSPPWGDDEGDDEGDDNLICLCHRPPGNPENSETICVGRGAACAHLLHGDTLGPCEEDAACGGTDAVECEERQFCKTPAGECAEHAEGTCMELPDVCPAIFAPVCGCDHRTYSNECYADAAGVGVAQEGPCEPLTVCGGIAGETCTEDELCLRPMGECSMDAEGVCVPLPEACPEVYRPVCGCDENSYDNACFALAAGVSIAAPGECEVLTTCGGTEGGTCDEGQFCKSEPGMCEEDAEGVCTEMPDFCPPVIRPVCGCDRMTYDNPCMADAAGVTVASMGMCEDSGVACGGEGMDLCAIDEFCRTETGECSEDAEGTCTKKPTKCPDHMAPVCGCDRVTYDNVCLAAAAGVNVAATGACVEPTICGGTEGNRCGDGEFCIRDTGMCADEDEGVCVEKPLACPPAVEPVCGCNQMEYTNECFAHAWGVTVQNEGPCVATSKAFQSLRRGWLRSPR